MAKALQCPDCGTRHPLDDVGGQKTFRCQECRRLLKVPAGLVAKSADPGPERAPKAAASAASSKKTAAVTRTPPSKRGAKVKGANASNGAATKVPPSQRGTAIADQTAKLKVADVERAGAPRTEVPRLVRVVAWVVAVPLGLVPVLLVGRGVGLFTSNDAVELFVGVGWSRYVPPLLLLLAWSGAAATVAHLIIERLGRSGHR